MTIQTNISLTPFTTIGLGGPARFFAACSSEADLREALSHAHREQLRVHILGGGSNTVFADEGFSGLVLYMTITGVEFTDRGTNVLARAAAGEPWDRIVEASVDRGLGGLECLSGIPGFVGATPMQNVGAYGQEVADAILSVDAVDRTTLQPVTFSNVECRFGYRTSRFKQEDSERFVITAVTFSLAAHGGPSLRYPELQRAIDRTINLNTLGNGRPALTAVRDAVL